MYPSLWYFDTSVTYPQWCRGVKFVIIPPHFVWQQYLWNVAIPQAVGCYNLWANICCSDCSSQGQKLLWNRTILRDYRYYESSMSKTSRIGSAFSSITSQRIITGHGKKNLKVLTHWFPRYVAAILKRLISLSFVIDVFSIFYEIFLWLMQRTISQQWFG